MRPILVVGRSGQLARALAERATERGFALVFSGRPDTDLGDPPSLERAILESGAKTIINAAAHTAVDGAEEAPERARLVNALGPLALAEAARRADARLIHVSTDYVFDGSGQRPWSESDPTCPAGVYGRTKLEGERAVRATLPAHVIVRTAWLYSPFASNFVTTMLNAARTRNEVEVVEDQIGNPTSALDLADGLLAILATWEREPRRGVGAIYHLAGTGETSWAAFAREIFLLSRARGGPSAAVVGIASADWPGRAPRPLNSRLNCDRFADTFGYRIPPWRESLVRIVDRILSDI